jgi:hypothetical protein
MEIGLTIYKINKKESHQTNLINSKTEIGKFFRIHTMLIYIYIRDYIT